MKLRNCFCFLEVTMSDCREEDAGSTGDGGALSLS